MLADRTRITLSESVYRTVGLQKAMQREEKARKIVKKVSKVHILTT